MDSIVITIALTESTSKFWSSISVIRFALLVHFVGSIATDDHQPSGPVPPVGPSNEEVLQKLCLRDHPSQRPYGGQGHRRDGPWPPGPPSATAFENSRGQMAGNQGRVILRRTGVISTQHPTAAAREIFKRSGRPSSLEPASTTDRSSEQLMETSLDVEASRLNLHYRFIVSARFVKAVTELRFIHSFSFLRLEGKFVSTSSDTSPHAYLFGFFVLRLRPFLFSMRPYRRYLDYR